MQYLTITLTDTYMSMSNSYEINAPMGNPENVLPSFKRPCKFNFTDNKN